MSLLITKQFEKISSFAYDEDHLRSSAMFASHRITIRDGATKDRQEIRASDEQLAQQ